MPPRSRPRPAGQPASACRRRPPAAAAPDPDQPAPDSTSAPAAAASAPSGAAPGEERPGRGFYDAGLTRRERCELEHEEPAEDLADEIKMLRVYTRRVFELGGEAENLPQAISTLRALAAAASQTAALLRQQRRFSEQETDEYLLALKETLREAHAALEARAAALAEGDEKDGI